MAEQAFGIKEFNLIGSGTPTISSPNNLNLKAATVAISTNISIGGTMSVTGGGTFGIGSTVGIGSTLYVSHGDLYLRDNHQLNINNDSLTMRGNNGGNSFITNLIDTSNGSPGNLYISNYSGDVEIDCSEHFSVKTNALAGAEQAILATQNGSVKLYHNDSGTGGILTLETSSTGITVNGTVAATAVTGDGSGLSNLPAPSPSTTDIQVVYEITGSSSSSNGYRFSGNAVDSSTPNPDLYLIRGKQYRFINNSGGTHPFEIRVSNGGAAYDTGVIGNNSSSGNIDFVPEFDAPAQLVYQCSQHGGMVGNIYLRGGNGNETNVGVTTHSSSATIHTNRILPVGGAPSGGGGGVIQVAVARLNSEIVDNNSNSFMASGLIVSMTPKFSSSKFHIHMGGGRLKCRSGTGVEVKMYVSINGGSYTAAYSGNRGSTFYYSSSGEIQLPVSFVDLYTPSSAPTTIAFQPYWRSFSNGNNTFLESDSNSYGEVVMTVMEVSA